MEIEKKRIDRGSGRSAGKENPDWKDREIMRMLSQYPPSSYREIAEAVTLSHVTVRQRVAWLINNEYLKYASGQHMELDKKGKVHIRPNSRRSKDTILAPKGFQFLWPEKYGKVGEPFRGMNA